MTDPPSPGTGVKGTVTAVELSRQERLVARRSAETRAIVPSIELAGEMQMDACLEFARQRDARPLAVVLAVLARCLQAVPRVNGAYRDGHYELYSRVNLGIALVGPDEPVIATLFDAAALTLAELDSELAELSERALQGRLSAAETSGATFTVTPPGLEGVTVVTPLIHPPQAGAMAIGAWQASPVVRSGALAVSQVARLTLACDHRIVQAHLGAQFLGELRRSLEAPAP